MVARRGTGRRDRMPFRKDIRAVEGFMTEIPALAMITIAITAFMISAISASGIYIADRDRAEALDKGKDISAAIRSYGPLLVSDRTGHLSASALDDLVAGNISLDLRNTGDMSVTVRESGSERTWTFRNTERTDAPRATVSDTVLIGHDLPDRPPSFLIGYLEVRTW